MRRISVLTILSAFLCTHFLPVASAEAAVRGGGVSTERYTNESFDFSMSYLLGWTLEEDKVRIADPRTTPLRSRAAVENASSSCARLGRGNGWCESVLVRNKATPQSWVEAVFVVDESVSGLPELARLAQRFSPQVPVWTQLDDNAYARGFTSGDRPMDGKDRASKPTTQGFSYVNAYLPEPGLVVFLSGEAFEAGDGILGVTLAKESVARASSGPRLMRVEPEKREVRQGQEDCVRLSLSDPKGGLSSASISSFVLRGDGPAGSRRRISMVKGKAGDAHVTLRVCTPVSPRFEEGDLALATVVLQNDDGRATACFSDPGPEATLLCTGVSRGGVGDLSSDRRVAAPHARIVNAAGDRQGPEILALRFDPGTRSVRVSARDPHGLGTATFFVSEFDGVTLLPTAWIGSGQGWGSTPLESSSRTEGELRVPVDSFRSRGGVMLRGGIVFDTLGNATRFAFVPNASQSTYVCKRDGTGACAGAPLITWLEMGKERP